MSINKITIHQGAPPIASATEPKRGHFESMLQKHYQEKKSAVHSSDNLTQNQNYDKENNWNPKNLESLRGKDQKYYQQGLKKKTLAESYAKRYGTNSEDRIHQFKSLIELKAKKYDLDPKLLAALIKQESHYNPYAVSHCGAMGLGQLMPATARSLGVTDPFNAAQNLDGAAKYLKQMLDKFGGNKEKALAAYNAGPGAVMKYGGIPPFSETQKYVRSIQKHLITIEKENIFQS